MNHLVDTQIVSLAFKGADESATKLAESSQISSVTACEFLLAHGKHAEKPMYYALPAKRYLLMTKGVFFDNELWGNKQWAKSGHRRTDQIVLEFNGEMPTLTEFGSQAISTMVNYKHVDLYRFCISHLDKAKQKYLTKRFEYLCDIDCHCRPLTKEIATLAMKTLHAFLQKHNPKANARNTVNDMLISATAKVYGLSLKTRDRLLQRFAAEFFGGTIIEDGDFIRIDYQSELNSKRRISAESKGFINRGWQVKRLRGQE